VHLINSPCRRSRLDEVRCGGALPMTAICEIVQNQGVIINCGVWLTPTWLYLHRERSGHAPLLEAIKD
jgi:hypothetical protein